MLLCPKHLYECIALGKIVETRVITKKKIRLPKLAEPIKNRGANSKPCKISTVMTFLEPISIFPLCSHFYVVPELMGGLKLNFQRGKIFGSRFFSLGLTLLILMNETNNLFVFELLVTKVLNSQISYIRKLCFDQIVKVLNCNVLVNLCMGSIDKSCAYLTGLSIVFFGLSLAVA